MCKKQNFWLVLVISVMTLGISFAAPNAGDSTLALWLTASNYNQATPPPFPTESSKEPVTPPVPPSPDQTVRFVIDSYLSYSVAIRNVGSDTIQTSQVGVYVNNQLRTCSWVSDVTTIPVGALRQCLFDGPPCTGGQEITISIAGVSHTVKC